MAWDEAAYIVNELKKNSGGGVIHIDQGPAFGSDGGAGMFPMDPSVFSAKNAYDGKVEIKVKVGKTVSLHGTATDYTIEYVPTVNIGGFKIIRKQGSAPRNYEDGVLIYDKKYEGWETPGTVTFMDTGLTNNVTYYYACYPYSDHGVINYRRTTVVSARPIVKPAYRLWAFDQNFADLNPSTTITYPTIGENTYFTPMTNTNNIINVGSWEPFLSETLQNFPFIIDKDTGKAVEALDELNYTQIKNGEVITSSSPYAQETKYGWFAWLKTIYMHEDYSSDGNSREVQFCDMPIDGFTPVGFTDGPNAKYQPEGIWIPIYPLMNRANESDNATGITMVSPFNTPYYPYLQNTSFDGIAMACKRYSDHPISGAGSRTYAIGPLMNMMRDLLYMICKTTYIRNLFGRNSTTYRGKVTFLNNISSTQGRFWGPNTVNKGAEDFLNRLFHSMAFGNFVYPIIDVSCFNGNNSFYYSYVGANNDYGGDRRNDHVKLPDGYISNKIATKLQYVDSYFGSIPDLTAGNGSGSTSSGLTDTAYFYKSTTEKVYTYTYRFSRDYTANEYFGFSSFNMYSLTQTMTLSNGALGLPILYPPEGYSPNPDA